ncbi:hypothetical protein ABKN59_000743 [Abortiporus biennis]
MGGLWNIVGMTIIVTIGGQRTNAQSFYHTHASCSLMIFLGNPKTLTSTCIAMNRKWNVTPHTGAFSMQEQFFSETDPLKSLANTVTVYRASIPFSQVSAAFADYLVLESALYTIREGDQATCSPHRHVSHFGYFGWYHRMAMSTSDTCWTSLTERGPGPEAVIPGDFKTMTFIDRFYVLTLNFASLYLAPQSTPLIHLFTDRSQQTPLFKAFPSIPCPH